MLCKVRPVYTFSRNDCIYSTIILVIVLFDVSIHA